MSRVEASRQPRGHRLSVLTTATVALAVPLAGCIPHFPPPTAPMSLDVVDGHLRATFCLGDVSISRVAASVREKVQGEWNDFTTIVTTSENNSVRVGQGSVLVLDEPSPEFMYDEVARYEPNDNPSLLSFTMSFDDGDGESGISATFRSAGLARMAEGTYLYSDGSVNDEPCEMNTAS